MDCQLDKDRQKVMIKDLGLPRLTSPAGTSEVVARGGVEPPTFRFSVGRSYQLSYLAVRAGHGPRVRYPSDPDGTRTRDLRRDRATR